MTATPARPIRTLLVANRGEIARRVFRTARAMGMRTVAVHSDADAVLPFVREADVAVSLGGSTSAESYLRADAVLAAALRTGADAIHPGYGFLSENAAFARAVAAAGLVWVGPPAAAIEAMGGKVEAKRLAAAAGVPTAASATLTGDDPDAWRNACDAVGYPLLVKASAGGGGRGMRLVERAADLAEAVQGARREAASAFGDPLVFAERYVRAARHIEVQVVADAHGAVIHLGERECSVQRRHQKIIEECPSSVLGDATRAAMGAASVALAAAIGYEGVGTVEFLYDDATRAFSFLEMNTRLQVEHPVTEAVTGLDLVRLQLDVAQGAPLPLAQDDVRHRGHAIEARLYAEDPSRGFVPSSGRLHRYRFAAADDNVRVDDAYAEGDTVTTFYDPMLAKVIVHAGTRREAALRLAGALARLDVVGLTTNREQLVSTLRHADFLAGATTTAFIDEHPETLLAAVGDAATAQAVHAAALTWLHAADRRRGDGLWGFAPSGWRNMAPVRQVLRLATGDGDTVVEVAYAVTTDGIDAQVATVPAGGAADDAAPASVAVVAQVVCRHDDAAQAELLVASDGITRTLTVSRRVSGAPWSVHDGTLQTVWSPVERFTTTALAHAGAGPLSPLPGRVVAVRVAAGAEVAAGTPLVVIEAMKMEHTITAAAAGTVVEVLVREGEQVDAKQLLVRLE